MQGLWLQQASEAPFRNRLAELAKLRDEYRALAAWLVAGLGPFFGLIGVESSADVAEETLDSRRVIPRTMFYALYCWQVFVKTPRGDHRVTGPGLP